MQPFQTSNDTSKHFQILQPEFIDLIGAQRRLRIIAQKDWDFAHEAGVWFPDTNKILFTSNRIDGAEGGTPKVNLYLLDIPEPGAEPLDLPVREVSGHSVVMGNGGTYHQAGRALILQQGYDFAEPKVLGAVLSLDIGTGQADVVCKDFYGLPFNSPNDVVVHFDSGTILFTDPPYGYVQKFKDSPSLPPQVYRFNPKRNTIEVVADGFVKPNGICFSPDQSKCYITDTGSVRGDGTIDRTLPSTIYLFDVVLSQPSNLPCLQNRRMFAYCENGIPDGIKVDTKGNVWSGCGDGVHIWNPEGILIGKILTGTGKPCSNLVFGPNQRLIILNERWIWEAQLAVDGAPLMKK